MPEQELTQVIPATESRDDKVDQMMKWLAGHVDKEGKHHPGLVQMVSEMYDRDKSDRERWEAIRRGLTIGGFVSSLGIIATWLRDHIK